MTCGIAAPERHVTSFVCFGDKKFPWGLGIWGFFYPAEKLANLLRPRSGNADINGTKFNSITVIFHLNVLHNF